jgi:uncharacterized membrane protein YraQ (UPF0718 family)
LTAEALPLLRRRRLPGGLSWLDVAFLAAAGALLSLGYGSPGVRTFALLYTSLVLEALPFLLLGALVGGVVEVFVSRERMAALLPRRRWLAVAIAAGLGVVFPVCECAVVPVVRRMTRKGLPVAAAVAYLLGGPIANPIVAASTAVAYRFDWRIAALRAGLGYVIALTIGLLVGRLLGDEALLDGGSSEESGECSCDHHPHPHHHNHEHERTGADTGSTPGSVEGAVPPPRSAWSRFGGRVAEALHHTSDELADVGRYFVMGAFIAALAQTFLDRGLLLAVAGRPSLAILAMMALAVALNLCSEADAFVAASFQGMVPFSAQLAFLLLGPILDLKLLLMYQTVFRRRAIAFLAAASVGLVLLVAAAVQLAGVPLGAAR